MNYLHEELNTLIKQDNDIFDFLQKSALDGLWYWDLENSEEEWMNDRFWETLGYDPDKMPHKAAAWQDIINPEDLETALDNFNKHYADPNHPYDQVVRYRHAKGHTVWIRCRGLIVRNGDNKPTRMLGAHTDITKQKESEINLQLKLNRYNQIIDGTSLAAWEWDLKNQRLILNENWQYLVDYKAEEVNNQDISFWAERVHPDDTPLARERLIEHFKKKSDALEFEMRIKNKAGEWIWTLCKGKVIKWDEEGRAELMTGYHQNITKRKKSEQALIRYKALLDQTNEVARIGTWGVDLVAQTVTWSPVTHQIHEVENGYNPNVEQGIKFYKAGENRQRITKVFTRSIEEGVPFDEELQIVTAKNNPKWIRTIGIPTLEKGKVININGVFQDITELKEAYLEAERLLKLKNEKNERLVNFSHIVSHNLRSHSVNLATLVRLMGKKHPETTENKFYKMLQESTENLSETILHLNEVASLNLATADGFVRLELRPFIEKAIANVKTTLEECEGSIALSNTESVTVRVIPAYLESIILNLLTNAIKYRSPQRKLNIDISTTISADEVTLTISDNGLGIDLKRHSHKIFGMYKVFHEHEDSRGIGLFICKGQVEAMDGTIGVESTVDVGSTFKITLKK